MKMGNGFELYCYTDQVVEVFEKVCWERYGKNTPKKIVDYYGRKLDNVGFTWYREKEKEVQ